MKAQLRLALFRSALLFLSTVVLHAGGRPITISDGSVCLANQGQAVPETENREYRGPFQPAVAFLEKRPGNASSEMKGCMPIETKCADCTDFPDVRSVVVQFQDGNAIRNVALNFDGKEVRVNTVDLMLRDWQPHGPPNDRRKVKRDGPDQRQHKIQWIFVNGIPTDCRTSVCRITIQNVDPAQAQ
ncbi:MAG: hypothetical protein EHM23_26670 [Acidobacteria bacterium]|nr:MAG: hypothetical protein EHM23_26670 [Acidobacteriota bacterium]